MRIITVAVLALMLTACMTPVTEEGFYKPTLWDSPVKYLKEVPLGVDKAVVLTQMGAPHKVAEVDGTDMLTWGIGDTMNRTYTYVFEGDALADVIYNDPGPYNGSKATEYQSEQ